MTYVAGTQPYAWPYDGCLDPARVALVLAGWDHGWADRVLDADAVAPNLDALRGVAPYVITVAHGGAAPLDSSNAVSAVGLDGFWGGPLDSVLRAAGRTHLLVAGHGLEGPVHSLLRGANDRGFECLLVTDACSALTPDCRDAAASMVCMSGGIFGAVGTTTAVVAALSIEQEQT